ncbi:hypothetical protein ACP275_10G103500 [Erythranthe tilingii]
MFIPKPKSLKYFFAGQIIINLLQPYAASIKPAQLGLKTTCIEKRGTLGGTCEEYRLVIWPPVRRFFNTLNKKTLLLQSFQNPPL